MFLSSTCKILGEKAYALTLGNHIAIHGRKRFTGMIVTTQKKEIHEQTEKTFLLFLVEQETKNEKKSRGNDHHQRRFSEQAPQSRSNSAIRVQQLLKRTFTYARVISRYFRIAMASVIVQSQSLQLLIYIFLKVNVYQEHLTTVSDLKDSIRRHIEKYPC